MRIIPKICTTFLATFSCLILNAQFSYTNKVEQAHQSILNLNFNKAYSIINEFDDNEQGMGHWLSAYSAFVEYKVSHKNLKVDSIIDLLENERNSIINFKLNVPFYKYCLADIYLMKAFLYFEKNELLRAFKSYSNSKTVISAYKKDFPQFNYSYKHDLIQITINQILSEKVGFDSETLEKEFANLCNYALNFGDELDVIEREFKLLSILLSDLYSDRDKYNEIAYVDINYARLGPMEGLVSSLKMRKNKEYEHQGFILKEAEKLGYFEKLNMFNLWYGDYLLSQGSDSSILHLETFISNQENHNFLNYARFKSSLFYFAKNEKINADSLLNFITYNSQSRTNEDRQALYEMDNAKYWTQELVKARLLFDGGNYNEALQVLIQSKDSIKSYSLEQKLEYSYRLARIYHMKKDYDKARIFYGMVINSNLDDRFYYPCYSAYYMGDVYYEINNIDKAYYYYALCRELDSPIYKLSIHKKAQQALKK